MSLRGFQIVLSDELRARLDALACFLLTSSSELARDAIREFVEKAIEEGGEELEQRLQEIQAAAPKSWPGRVRRRNSKGRQYHRFVSSRAYRKGQRKRVMDRDDYTCQRCGEDELEQLDVHHRRYRELLGTEPDSDLVTLCKTCHARTHEGSQTGGGG